MKQRKQHHEEHANHERWLVSYADFITLMFAFFVVMYAAANAGKGTAAQVSAAVSRALSEDGVSSAVATAIAGKAGQGGATAGLSAAQLVELAQSMEHLSKELEEEIASGKVQVDLNQRGLVISLKEAAFFPTGDSTIMPDAYPILAKIAATIRPLPNQVRLEGHTDSIPISNGRFQSNWHLSAARSIAVLEMFHQKFTVPTGRLAAVGYADTIPVVSNDTPEGRAKNRRVDVTILNHKSEVQEPHAS